MMRPLLRWAGSKRQLVPVLKAVAPLEYRTYAEPFAGSAALFFALAPSRGIISDSNPELINFFRAMRRCPRHVYTRAIELPRTRRMYKRLRKADVDKLTSLERAIRFFYLNRLCFNGVYRVNRDGQFNVPMGSKPSPFPSLEDVLHYADLLSVADVRCCDFSSVIRECGKGDFIYADPPYYSQRHRGEYGSSKFTGPDLSRLIEDLEAAWKRGAHVALSYSISRSLKRKLNSWEFRPVKVRRTVAGDFQVREVGTEGLFVRYAK